MKEIFKLTDEDVTRVQRVFDEMTSRRTIIAELINTSPNSKVEEFEIFREYKQLSKEFRSVSNDVISKATDGKWNGDCNWNISFDKKELSIGV
jgi:hypothetical protein